MKTILYIHSHLISQFANIVRTCNNRYNQIFICCIAPDNMKSQNGVACIDHYDEKSPERNGSNVLQCLAQMKNQKIQPDLIVIHVGDGTGMFVHEIFPDVPIIGYVEWFYVPNNTSNIRRNNMIRNEINNCAICIAPTKNQRSKLPMDLRMKTVVMHEGVDSHFFVPMPELPLPPDMDGDDKFIITYVSRGLEPMRCFMEFIKGIIAAFEDGLNIMVKIVGQDNFFYDDNPKAISFKEEAEKMLGQYGQHVQFLGGIGKAALKDVYQSSNLHIYFTKDFALSWSFLESMVMSCVVLGSNTKPVQEFIEDGQNGFLVDHENPEAIRDKIKEIMALSTTDREKIKAQARQMALETVSADMCAMKWDILFSSVMN
jgi:glycosyltransferase involved in cell wall biosynthesis